MLPLIGSLTIPTLLLGGLFIVILVYFRQFDCTTTRKIKRQKDHEQRVKEKSTNTNTNNQVKSEAEEDAGCQSQREEPGSSCCQNQDGGGGGGQVSCCTSKKTLRIVYGTVTGNAKNFAQSLVQTLKKETSALNIIETDIGDYDPEEHLVGDAGDEHHLILIVSTYTEGTPPESAEWFYAWLEEAAKDFRVQHSLLKGLKYAVFGLGNSLYADHFNTIGKNCDKYLFQLSAERFHPLGLGDENVAGSKLGCMENDFDHWKNSLASRVKKSLAEGKQQQQQKTSDLEESNESDYEMTESESDYDEDDLDGGKEEMGDGLVDLEDMGKVMKKAKEAKMNPGAPKEMITPILRKSLTKQGYKLIGSHSGVKICRWTKAMLRGRGGCYKHTFYGIESHRYVAR